MISSIESPRLLLRPWESRDVEIFIKFYNDKNLARFVGGRKTAEEAWRHLACLIGHWYLKGFGYWAVEEKTSGDFVGCCGLWYSQEWPEVELGYWLLPQHMGKGFATEAGMRSLQYASSTLSLTSVVSYIDPANEPSKKVAKRLGGTFEKTIELLSFGLHEVYRYNL
ncbi:MAG: GNAT family N-acetyltransferase [Saprospiraceae bacterium]|nr:GNAT family N-acetyltransferase [Saprospiraceae bacterium]